MVLIPLLLAFVVVTIIAFFAFLFTGKYPKGLLDFNVGVLQWTWRVSFYTYAALGTDRYPPFRFKVSDYPATLVVEYPERLSRGLLLVKWILAFPHYLVELFIQGGTGLHYGGLNLLLVLFAGVMLLFAGRYPKDMFELVLRINRWVYRIAVHVALMRDEYPLFRLGP